MTANRSVDDDMMSESCLLGAASVSDTARALGLSRARFYQLLGSAFPLPVYDVTTRRPFFTAEQQRVCLDVRKRNLGIDGRPILFYARRKAPLVAHASRRRAKTPIKSSSTGRWADLVEGLKAIGMDGVTESQVDVVIRESCPSGTDGIERGELLRRVYRSLRCRQNSTDSVR